MSQDLKTGIAVADIEDGRPLAACVGDKPVVVVRSGGKICVLAGECTHAGAPLADGLVVDGELRCPWHHARFSLATGQAIGAPAFEPLARYDVVEEDGQVRVTGESAEAAPKTIDAELGQIVIIGSGGAGHACAEMLARHGAGASVTLVSADGEAPYDRTVCSKELLAGDLPRDDAFLPDAPGVTIRLGTEVASIDAAGRAVVTAEGDRLPYDVLVLATGAEPQRPAFEGADRDDVHLLRTLDDADRLIAAAGQAKRAIVLGSSYIGLEAAASLIQRGLEVAVIAPDEVPLGKTAGPEVGGFVQALHEKKGVDFHLGRTVARWDGETATLDDGTKVAADMIVAGVGVSPRVALAEAAGLAIASKDSGSGVEVDGFLRTSAAGIHAIGDIARYPDPRLGHAIRVEHWVVAQRMGQWLARHLLGLDPAPYRDTPFFWSGHYGSNLRYVGHVADTGDRRIDGDLDEGDFAVTFREKGADQALLTCGRDKQALQAEAGWDDAA